MILVPAAVATVAVIVPDEAEGVRVDRFLAAWLVDADDAEVQGLSRSRLQRLIQEGAVLLNDAAVRVAARVHPGDLIQLRLPQPEPLALVPEPVGFSILYEDSDIIVVDKPRGLVVHPGAGHHSGTLVHGLLHHCSDLSGIGGTLRPGIVHRLDRGTSGVMVVAKNDRAHAALAKQFALRELRKRYIAFVVGEPKQMTARIETLHGRHPTDRKRFSSKVAQGRTAVTHYRVVKAGAGVAKLEIGLETGRTHQIRVHLFDLGYPVLGDPMYGGQRLARVKSAALVAAAKRFVYQALHAARLEFAHPADGRTMVAEAPLPPDMAELDRLLALAAG